MFPLHPTSALLEHINIKRAACLFQISALLFVTILENIFYILLLFLWITVTFCVTVDCTRETIVATMLFGNIYCNLIYIKSQYSGVTY
jgi:hypothetical protein